MTTDGKTESWTIESLATGMMIVTNREKQSPFLYVYGPDVNDPVRYSCCLDLQLFLNGGPRPRWLDDMKRTTENHAQDNDGTYITAVGPMIDRNPPNMDLWPDESDESYNARARLMDRLFLERH